MESLVVNDYIRLEKLNLSMAPQIFSAIDNNRGHLKTWLPFIELTQEVSDTEKFIREVMEQSEIKKDEIFSIWVYEEFAGLIGFKDTDWVNFKTEIGYWLVEKMQGRGIITSCVKKLIAYAFRKLKLNRVQIKVGVGNTKSAAIPKRLGFRFEGVERAGEKHDSRFLDLEVYSLLHSDSVF